MAQKFSNGARALLAAAINSTDTAFSIESGGALFPIANTGTSAISSAADWFKLVIQDQDGYEIIYVRTHTSASNDFSNVLRGQEGTTARGFTAGATVGLRPTAGDADHVNKTDNPHGVTKAQVGLGNVDNTSDANKPVSTATQTALDGKANTSHGHAIADVTGLQSALDGKAASSHTHSISNVTGLQDALDAKASAASPTLTGAIAQNGSVRGNVIAMGALSVDCSAGNYFTKTISGASTFTFDNVPSGAYGFTLELTHTSGTVTWPSSVKWPSDTAPTLTTGKTHLFMFVTDDGGTRWRGAALADYVS